MCLNGDKFEHHRIGNNLKIEKHSYTDPNGEVINEKEYIKDLGVYISSDLTWTRQINEVASKAISMAGWALRTFKTRKELPMVTIWNSLVRPCLDYCSPLWSPRPSNFHEIDLLEKIQKNFTRQIDGMEGLDYAKRLERLHIYSTERRNERFKIINVYKIKENLVPNVSSTHGLHFETEGRRGCICKIPYFPPGGRARKARDSSFAYTACNLWNSLPRCVRDITGKDVMFFKNKLDKVLAYYPDVPRCSDNCHSLDRNMRKSNSLCDHYRNKQTKAIVNGITKV